MDCKQKYKEKDNPMNIYIIVTTIVSLVYMLIIVTILYHSPNSPIGHVLSQCEKSQNQERFEIFETQNS